MHNRGISPLYSTFITLVAVVVVGAGVYFALFSGEPETPAPTEGPGVPTQTQPEPSDTGTTTETDDGDATAVDILPLLVQSKDAEIALLQAVDGSEASGTGHRLVQNGTLYHGVIATLPNPADGAVYEGWLVQPASAFSSAKASEDKKATADKPEPLKFFSTGVMTQQEEGVYTLEFSAEETFPSYTRVVITEEETVDETPERHVIEGDF